MRLAEARPRAESSYRRRLPALGAGLALERTQDVVGDPTTIEAAGLLAGDVAGVHQTHRRRRGRGWRRIQRSGIRMNPGRENNSSSPLRVKT